MSDGVAPIIGRYAKAEKLHINSSLNFHICYYAAFLASIKSSFMTLRFIAGLGLIPDTHIILW